MTNTQGRLVDWHGPDGIWVGTYDSVDYPYAAEIVRRWNAFEPGGAVEQAIEALREFLDFAPRVRSFESENESIANGRALMASQSEFYMWVIAQARAAIAALAEGGQ